MSVTWIWILSHVDDIIAGLCELLIWFLPLSDHSTVQMSSFPIWLSNSLKWTRLNFPELSSASSERLLVLLQSLKKSSHSRDFAALQGTKYLSVVSTASQTHKTSWFSLTTFFNCPAARSLSKLKQNYKCLHSTKVCQAAVILDDAACLLQAPFVVDVLNGRKIASTDVLWNLHRSLWCFTAVTGAIPIPILCSHTHTGSQWCTWRSLWGCQSSIISIFFIFQCYRPRHCDGKASVSCCLLRSTII